MFQTRSSASSYFAYGSSLPCSYCYATGSSGWKINSPFPSSAARVAAVTWRNGHLRRFLLLHTHRCSIRAMQTPFSSVDSHSWNAFCECCKWSGFAWYLHSTASCAVRKTMSYAASFSPSNLSASYPSSYSRSDCRSLCGGSPHCSNCYV